MTTWFSPGRIEVLADGLHVENLNELECVDGPDGPEGPDAGGRQAGEED